MQTLAKQQQFLAAEINICYDLGIEAKAISIQCISVMFIDFCFLKLNAQNKGFPKTNIHVSRVYTKLLKSIP